MLAAEYVLVEGNPNVVLCERGIRGFDPHTRNVADLGGALRLKELTHLPVILDPSHATGRSTLIEPLTLAAAAAGLDGAIVEMHPQPERSRCDAAQAIDPATFARIARRARTVRAAIADEVLGSGLEHSASPNPSRLARAADSRSESCKLPVVAYRAKPDTLLDVGRKRGRNGRRNGEIDR